MRWLLRFIVTEADRRAIESDLTELFELRRRHEGDVAAARWLRRQRLFYPMHIIVDRIRGFFGAMLSGAAHLTRDIPYSARSLARTPALTATIVLTVGIGLGATTAMVGVVRAVLVNPLPYASSDDLFWIYTDNAPYRFRLSVVDYRALEADHPAFSAVAAYQPSDGYGHRQRGPGASGRASRLWLVLRAPGTVRAPRPPVRRFGRRTQRADRRY